MLEKTGESVVAEFFSHRHKGSKVYIDMYQKKLNVQTLKIFSKVLIACEAGVE